MRPLVLASSSRYRQLQLAQLGYPFTTCAPDIDESPREGETADALSSRLALSKATAAAPRFPDALIIGSDQVASCHGQLIGKPGDLPQAMAQWQGLRGQSVQFHSAVALLDTCSGQHWQAVTNTLVRYRPLTDAQILAYLERDRPFDCAGSFKSEALGIAVLESVQSDDPSALVGLPLIALCDMLAAAGVDLLTPSPH